MKTKTFCIILLAVFCIISPTAFAKNPNNTNNDLVTLGQAIYNDLNLSLNKNQSCMTCHHPSSGFADPANRISPVMFPVSDGSVITEFGGRNAPSAAYAGFSPIFHYDPIEGLFIGGLFWDGRATGMTDNPIFTTTTGGLGAGPTGDPLADQAKGPFGNPVEMSLTLLDTGVTTEEAVIGIIQASVYADKFEKVFGPNAFADIGVAYNNASLAIAAFERSNKLNFFKSKFDKFVEEQGGDISAFGVDADRNYTGPPPGFQSKVYSYDEADGLAIFNANSYTQRGEIPPTINSNGGQCYLCHLTENHMVDAAFNPANGPAEFGPNPDGSYNPMLTDFTYDNLGIPVNPQIAALGGAQPTDFGLGGQVAQLDAAFGGVYPDVAGEEGKFKVSSLRNLSRTAPYGHNGYFATIYDVVHFYNTRDALATCSDPLATGEVIGVNCWPVHEAGTPNGDELGNLGLTFEQELKLVQFMETLND